MKNSSSSLSWPRSFPRSDSSLSCSVTAPSRALPICFAWRAIGPAYPEGGPARDNAVAMMGSGFGGVKAVGRTLYLASVLPFEITSLLLLVAVVAAVVVAKGKI